MEPTSDGGYILNLKGNFTNGPAHVRIKVGVNGWKPQINDIEVDGVSAVASAGK
jgi:hypothetical protein